MRDGACHPRRDAVCPAGSVSQMLGPHGTKSFSREAPGTAHSSTLLPHMEGQGRTQVALAGDPHWPHRVLGTGAQGGGSGEMGPSEQKCHFTFLGRAGSKQMEAPGAGCRHSSAPPAPDLLPGGGGGEPAPAVPSTHIGHLPTHIPNSKSPTIRANQSPIPPHPSPAWCPHPDPPPEHNTLLPSPPPLQPICSPAPRLAAPCPWAEARGPGDGESRAHLSVGLSPIFPGASFCGSRSCQMKGLEPLPQQRR